VLLIDSRIFNLQMKLNFYKLLSYYFLKSYFLFGDFFKFIKNWSDLVSTCITDKFQDF